MTPERKFVLGVDRLLKVVLFALFAFVVVSALAGPGTPNAPVLHDRIGQGTSNGPGFAPMQRGSAATPVAPIPPAWDSVPYAVSFDGVDDFASATAFGLPGGSSSRTMMAWVLDIEPTSSGERWFLGYGAYSAYGDAFALFLSGAPGLTVAGYYEDYRWTVARVASWTHWAVTYPGTGSVDLTKTYRNGVLLTSGTWSYNGAPTVLNTSLSGPLYLGRGRTGIPFLMSKMAEVAIFNRALSQSEIQFYYPTRLTGTEPDLIRLYHCDEGLGTTLVDACGSGYNMTLYNGATWTSRL